MGQMFMPKFGAEQEENWKVTAQGSSLIIEQITKLALDIMEELDPSSENIKLMEKYQGRGFEILRQIINLIPGKGMVMGHSGAQTGGT